MSDEQAICQFKWIIPKSQIESERAALVAAGARMNEKTVEAEWPDDESRGEPMSILFGGIALAFLAERIATVVRDWKRGGAIVDARQEELKIYKNLDLPPGSVVIINKKGNERLDNPNPYSIVNGITSSRPTKDKEKT